MTQPSASLAAAIRHFQAGQLANAEQVVRQVLAAMPNHPAALNLWGLIQYRLGQHAVALASIEQAIRYQHDDPLFHNNRGITLRALGRLDEAVQALDEALALDPRCVDALVNLGLTQKDRGDLNTAVLYYRRAMDIRPDCVEACISLGNALKALGQLDAAIETYRKTLELRPDFVLAINNLGNAYVEQGQTAAAIDCYQRALGHNPRYAEAHYNLGNVLSTLGQFADAIACLRRAIALKPNYVDARLCLGKAWHEQGRFDEAIAELRQALLLDPRHAEGHFQLGIALRGRGDLDAAIASFRQALALSPAYPAVHNYLGIALKDRGELEQAIDCYRRAIELQPDFTDAYVNLGNACSDRAAWDEADRCYRRALELSPASAEAHTYYALLCLLQGDFARGWDEYEWRWRCKTATPFRNEWPLWNGESVQGKTLLIRAEQGLGDTFQFVRYVPLVVARGANVIVQCQEVLLPFLAPLFPAVQWIGWNERIPACDCYIPLMSLPRLFKTTPHTIPARVPYLSAPATLVEQWKARLQSLAGFKVGIVWQGNPKNRLERYRSIPLRHFAAVARVPGVQLISLQRVVGQEQLAEIAGDFQIADPEKFPDQDPRPFLDIAAIIQGLDLVISCDSGVAHLAGALGAPVWLGLGHVHDWRWQRDRTDSPWYPTFTLFRQPSLGDWTSVFTAMADQLPQRIA